MRVSPLPRVPGAYLRERVVVGEEVFASVCASRLTVNPELRRRSRDPAAFLFCVPETFLWRSVRDRKSANVSDISNDELFGFCVFVVI